MAISLRKIAKKAGVSVMTVSRAVRGAEGVGPELRQQILMLAREAGYPIPKSERRPAVASWGVLCAIGVSGDEGGAEFHRRIIAGIKQGAQECRSEVLNYSGPTTVWPLVVARNQVDGVIVARGNERNRLPPFPPPVPAVFLFLGPENADVVTVDHFAGSRALGWTVGKQGHRRAAYLGPESEISRERLAGFRTGLESTGGEVPSAYVRLLPDAGSRNSARLLVDQLIQTCGFPKRASRSFTVLMVYNDYMAAAAIERLGELGIKVPDDLSVVGFDAQPPSWYEGPTITTVALPLEELGAEAARLVYWRLTHPEAPVRRLILGVQIVEGATLAKGLTLNAKPACP